jgi:CheY-like chemotaxis protein
VVVVDDESAIVEGMTVLLTGWGARVIGSTTGDDVVEAVHAAGQLPDLLIVDYRLGNSESGIQLAHRIRQELDPEIPALLVTGSISAELAGQAQAAGLAFMLKPVMASTLREQIGKLLNVHLASETIG